MAHAAPHSASRQIVRATQMRRTARLATRFEQALAAMHDRGATLHLQFSSGSPLWSLSDGSSVTAEVAALLLNSVGIEPVGCALFPGMPAQTWRYANDN
jgi:hypothetical protein